MSNTLTVVNVVDQLPPDHDQAARVLAEMFVGDDIALARRAVLDVCERMSDPRHTQQQSDTAAALYRAANRLIESGAVAPVPEVVA